MINKDFIKDVLSGQKRLLKMSILRSINAPCFMEVSVKKLYTRALSMPSMKLYFPDTYPKGQQCDCKYFFDVWNTLYP